MTKLTYKIQLSLEKIVNNINSTKSRVIQLSLYSYYVLINSIINIWKEKKDEKEIFTIRNDSSCNINYYRMQKRGKGDY